MAQRRFAEFRNARRSNDLSAVTECVIFGIVERSAVKLRARVHADQIGKHFELLDGHARTVHFGSDKLMVSRSRATRVFVKTKT